MHLHEDTFLHRRCVDCPSQAPACNCGVGYQCVVTTRVCDQCGSATCVPEASADNSNKSSGVSGGAIAGAVIGVLILLCGSISLLIWYRRRQRAEKTREQPSVDPKPDVPARAEAVLSRPDPVEKPVSPSTHEPESVRMYSVMSNSTINLDPQAGSATSAERRQSGRGSTRSNPFTDTHSIQTTSASTQSTNVIPIALVPHGSVSSPPHSPASDNRSSSSAGSAPMRPARSPDLGLRFDPLSSGLNLEHVNVSKDSFRPPNAFYAQSQVSGVSGVSYRDSVMTSGSFASDVLYEAPQIVTNAGRVNFLKAEVVSVQNTGPGSPNSSSSGGQNLAPGAMSRVSKAAPARSPLAQSSFGPADAMSVSESGSGGQEIEYHPQRNPFGDEHSPRLHTARTTTTFGTPVPIPSTADPDDQYPRHHTEEQGTDDSPVMARPTSTLTQAASIIGAEIGGATVVRLNSTSSANNRLTSARLITPTSGPLRSQDDRILQQQQAQALAAARARAAASGLPMPSVSSSSSSITSGSSIGGSPNPAFLHARRVSEASTMSAGADSLLESFTFVPPSPIANRPPRSPSSPLATQAVGLGNGMMPPVPPLPKQKDEERERQNGSGKEEVTNRQVQGMSTASTGIEGYDFRIDDGTSTEIGNRQGQPNDEQSREQARASAVSTVKAARAAKTGTSKPPPSAASNKNLNVVDGSMKERQRASLDTLALTADLSAFPLSFDEGRGGFGASK